MQLDGQTLLSGVRETQTHGSGGKGDLRWQVPRGVETQLEIPIRTWVAIVVQVPMKHALEGMAGTSDTRCAAVVEVPKLGWWWWWWSLACYVRIRTAITAFHFSLWVWTWLDKTEDSGGLHASSPSMHEALWVQPVVPYILTCDGYQQTVGAGPRRKGSPDANRRPLRYTYT